MTRWMSFIDPSVGDGQNTINGIIDNGSTYGIGISDDLNITGLSTFTDTVRFTSTVRLDGELRDGDNAFGTSGQVLSSDGTDTRWINAASLSAGAASQIAINADSTTNASRFITFVDSSSGNNTLKTDTGLTYNPNSNKVFASIFEAGNGSGSVAMTTNDGHGNANICFNHESGVPDVSGSSGRIECAVDSSTATMFFELKNNVSSGTAVTLTSVLDLLETQIKPHKNIIPNSDSSISIGSDSVRFSNGYFDTVYGSGANLTSLNATNISSGTLNTARLPNTYTKAAKVTIQATGLTNDVHLDAADNIIFEAGEEEDGAIYFRGNSGADSYRFSKSGQTTHEGFLSFESLGADRTFTFPNATGTVALTSSDITGNAATATKWASGINFDIIGEVTGAAVSFDGSSNLTFDADIANDVVDEANLKVSNSPTNGYFLQAQSGNTGGLTWAEVNPSNFTSLGALTSLDCNGAADFDGGQVNIRYDHASTPALYVRNNTTYNQIIARFVGNSASLDIENISTGDYFFGHPTQHNGFQFFDTTGGVDIVYNNTVSVEFDSGNNFGDFKGTPSVNGTNIDHFASGTKMIFQQTSAPTGWTKITSNTNQRALRVVSGTAGSGGSHNFTTVFTSSRATSGASVSSHTLTTSQIPSHTHDTPNHTHTVSFDIGNTDLDHTHGAGNYNTDSQGNHSHEITDHSSQDSGDGFSGYQQGDGGSGDNNINSSSTGAHTHDITGQSASGLGNHNHDVHNMSVGNANPTTHSEGGGSGHSHGFTDATVNLAVRYLDVIIAAKD